jgi:hypothetical protein
MGYVLRAEAGGKYRHIAALATSVVVNLGSNRHKGNGGMLAAISL